MDIFKGQNEEEIRAVMELAKVDLENRTTELKKMALELARLKAAVQAQTEQYHQYVAMHANIKKTPVISLSAYRGIISAVDNIIDETDIKQKEETKVENAYLKLKARLDHCSEVLAKGPAALKQACQVYRGHFGSGSGKTTERP
jgi:flagellar biosynthesis chaperone FliJ